MSLVRLVASLLKQLLKVFMTTCRLEFTSPSYVLGTNTQTKDIDP